MMTPTLFVRVADTRTNHTYTVSQPIAEADPHLTPDPGPALNQNGQPAVPNTTPIKSKPAKQKEQK